MIQIEKRRLGGMKLGVEKERRKQDKATDGMREEVETPNMVLSSFASALEEGRNIVNNEWVRKAKFEARGIANTKQSGAE